MSNSLFNFNFLALLLSEILGGHKFTLGGLRPLNAPSGEMFLLKASISQCLIVFLISTFQLQYFSGYQAVPNLHQGALRSPEAPQRKNFETRTSTCLYLSNCKFSASQLDSRGTNGALSLHLVCIKNLPKWGFCGDFGGGVKIFGRNPFRNAITADLRRLVKKLWRCSKYPSLYTRQRNYKKKQKKECLRREGYISPVCSAYPPKPLVTPWCMLGLWST